MQRDASNRAVAAAVAVVLAVLAGWANVAVAQPATTAAQAGAAPAAQTPAEKENPALWKPRVTSVAVFKNGLGFFIREGRVAPRDGWAVSKEIPPAAFGTLAIFSKDDDALVDVVGSGPGEIVEFDGVDAPTDLAAKRGRLEAAAGLKVQLTYKHEGSDRLAAGVLRGVGAEFAILESEAQHFAVPLEKIGRMQTLELPIRVHVTREKEKSDAAVVAAAKAVADAETEAKNLHMSRAMTVAEKAAAEQRLAEAQDLLARARQETLGMAYLRKGITWIPEYTLKVLDDDTAELTLRGTLVNEAEDLVHADVSFVVGVPHFTHTEYLAPIAVGQIIRTIGTAVAPAQVQTQIMNRAALVSQEANRGIEVLDQPVPAAGGDVGRALGNLPQMDQAGAGTDYFVYTKPDLTVRRGEKAIVTLFRQKIRYSHIYRWEAGKAMEHSLVLHNATDTPWTTGPALAISRGSPLTEDLLRYVPKGGSGELPVTAAINIAHEKTETESDRKLKAHSPASNVYFDLVTLQGKVQLRNFEKRPVKVVISIPVPGKPIEAGDEGAITVDTTQLKLTERTGAIRWTVTLEPDEKKTLTYSYERYVPSL